MSPIRSQPFFRKRPVDHVADVLLHLEEAGKALDRVDDAKINTSAREAMREMRAAVVAGKAACADGLEALLGGSLTRNPTPQSTENTENASAADPFHGRGEDSSTSPEQGG